MRLLRREYWILLFVERVMLMIVWGIVMPPCWLSLLAQILALMIRCSWSRSSPEWRLGGRQSLTSGCFTVPASDMMLPTHEEPWEKPGKNGSK